MQREKRTIEDNSNNNNNHHHKKKDYTRQQKMNEYFDEKNTICTYTFIHSFNKRIIVQ